VSDEEYMKLALRLARKGLGKTRPNPMVGAVIVKGDLIIGQGYHHCFGGDHAEIDAFKSARESLAGATLYVTLEPCCHRGEGKKTPPCTDAIIRERIGRVVIGTLDPNPRVCGNGIKHLNEHGIETKIGVLEAECRALNEVFFKFMSTGVPFVTLKFAQTLDGRIAAATGDSKWISGEKFRKLAHKLRSVHDAVLVGIDTVLADDPELTVRLVKGRNPTRVILDSRLRIPPKAKVLTSDAPTIIATTPRAGEKKLSRLRETGVEVLTVPVDEQGDVDLRELLKMLAERNVSSVLVEGGSGVITSFLRWKLVDKIIVAVAPKIMGRGVEAVGDLNIKDVSQALKLDFMKVYRLGEDVVIEGRLAGGWK